MNETSGTSCVWFVTPVGVKDKQTYGYKANNAYDAIQAYIKEAARPARIVVVCHGAFGPEFIHNVFVLRPTQKYDVSALA